MNKMTENGRKRNKTNVSESDEHNDKSVKRNRKSQSSDDCPSITPMTSQYFTSSRLLYNFFMNIPCVELSKSLLGQILCRKLPKSGVVLKGKIVETESYCGTEDAACNRYKGRRTNRNEPLYMSPGTCYVHLTHGIYHCFCLSCEGDGAAVLIRALEPIQGIDEMQSLRHSAKKKNNDNNELPIKQLTNGPSKLYMAFDINRFNINKVNITLSDDIWLEAGHVIDESEIVICKRIGINNAGEWNDKPLRYYIKNNQYVSVRDKDAESHM